MTFLEMRFQNIFVSLSYTSKIEPKTKFGNSMKIQKSSDKMSKFQVEECGQDPSEKPTDKHDARNMTQNIFLQ